MTILPHEILVVAHMMRRRIGIDRDESLSLAGVGYAKAITELKVSDKQFVRCAFRRALDVYRTESGYRKSGWQPSESASCDELVDPADGFMRVDASDVFAWAMQRTSGIEQTIVSSYKTSLSMSEIGRHRGISVHIMCKAHRTLIKRLAQEQA